MVDIERMIEYNIHQPNIYRAVKREQETEDRMRQDDNFKWTDDGIF